MSKADTDTLMARLIRFDELLDRMEGMLRSNVGDGTTAPSPVLTTEEREKQNKQIDEYIKRWRYNNRVEAAE